jgi:hypothetical protein
MMENTEKKILDRIAGEPGYRLGFYKILKFCETPRSSAEVEEEIRSFPEMKTAMHSSTILMGWLEEVGGVERVVLEEGEEEEERWQTTEAGRKVAEMEAPAKRLLELISKESVYSEAYMQVLSFCQTPRTRAEIEELLQGNPVMEKPKVYPTFFIQGLEEAGGLEWADKHWRTTEAGKSVLE